jgi:hypothetical protein
MVAGSTTLASVNSTASDRMTKKKPAENPRPSISRWAPGEPMPVASRTENKAPTVTKPPASMASTRICATDSRCSRRVP